MRTIITIILIFCALNLLAQGSSISDDGKYIAVFNLNDNSLKVVTADDLTSKSFKNVDNSEKFFSSDSRHLIIKQQDSLFVIDLLNGSKSLIANVVSYRLFANRVAYLKGKNDQSLVIHDLLTDKDLNFDNISDYQLGPNANCILLHCNGKQNGTVTLKFVDLANGNSAEIWQSKLNQHVIKYQFDQQERQIAFTVQDRVDSLKKANAIWYFKEGMKKAEPLADDQSTNVPEGMVLSDKDIFFSNDGQKVFCFLHYSPKKEEHFNEGQVTAIWSYTDPVLETLTGTDRQFLAVIDPDSRHLTRLEHDDDIWLNNDPYHNKAKNLNGNLIVFRVKPEILKSKDQDYQPGMITYTLGEWSWNKATIGSVYIVSTDDGTSKLLKSNVKVYGQRFPFYRITPDGRNVLYYDQLDNAFFSYEVTTGIKRNLSNGISINWLPSTPRTAITTFSLRPNQVYTDDNNALVIDHYGDIWKLDISGKTAPINLTNGYAAKMGFLFYFETSNGNLLNFHKQIIVKSGPSEQQPLFINEGYYAVNIESSGDPVKLIERGGVYQYSNLEKADKSDCFLITRENAKEPRKEYFTTNFKTYRPIFFDPKIPKRGLAKQLISWKLGKQTQQGYLYLPEKFNPKEKYPVIITYYEERHWADNFYNFESLNEHAAPDLEPSYLVTHGYIYFICPAGPYHAGNTGNDALNTVVAGAKAIMKLPYVDPKHIGIYGHSFGGFETNYIVTHTHLFTAAYTSAGASDFFHMYGTEAQDEHGFSYMSTLETGQFNLGASPWERPDIYLKNSPVFFADRVTTPLLMTHGIEDHRVPFSQAVELFTALRRLGKPCWFIMARGGHGGLAVDHVIQFFDHYLKGAPTPQWMLNNLPGEEKIGAKGLELSLGGQNPGPGLLMKNPILTSQQKELLKHKTMVDTNGRIVDVH